MRGGQGDPGLHVVQTLTAPLTARSPAIDVAVRTSLASPSATVISACANTFRAIHGSSDPPGSVTLTTPPAVTAARDRRIRVHPERSQAVSHQRLRAAV